VTAITPRQTPLYNGDDEAENGVPETAQTLARQIAFDENGHLTGEMYIKDLTALMENLRVEISR
jgi:hypothetical protein